jgi:precorrin-2 dehydrogenase/sirohydrochlorin ferrochelatase
MRIPMYIDITGYKILILGGGYEATKKAKRFMRYGPEILVYSLDFSKELKQLEKEGDIKLVYGDVREIDRVEELIKDTDIVIYAVPSQDEIEKKVKEICKKNRKLHIISTNAQITQIAMPIETEMHGLRFTAYSAGKSTLVAILALDEVKKCLAVKGYLATLLEAMHHLKIYMKERRVPYHIRMKMYRHIVKDKDLMKYACKGDLEEAISYVRKKVDELYEKH